MKIDRSLIILLLLVFAMFGIPVMGPALYSSLKIAPRNHDLENAREIALGLQAFKAEYGSYPCEATRAEFERDGIHSLRPGHSANAYLAQLLTTKVVNSEVFFYTHQRGILKGDDLSGTPVSILAPGENGFAYVMNANGEPLRGLKSETPVIIAALHIGGLNPTFDPETYRKKCIYGTCDGSAKVSSIDKNGHALTEEDKPLFDTGPGTLFETETPVVVAPLIK